MGVRGSVHPYVCTKLSVYIHIYICICIQTCVYTYICVYKHVCVLFTQKSECNFLCFPVAAFLLFVVHVYCKYTRLGACPRTQASKAIHKLRSVTELQGVLIGVRLSHRTSQTMQSGQSRSDDFQSQIISHQKMSLLSWTKVTSSMKQF